ncbi:MAG: 50S ribosomal protein L4 [Proteobacteria bacterium]|jgi:large subunit ribosomal protein L4|nr:50S ribosomal protein L4 [Pseudomonadota bacterium]MBK9252132.1 50S ribosomal protein L4 [Pseudomonadota bacterium]MCC6633666.1 50S ribosomal protein L4 [Gammaproteobacteria bacterium]
MKLKVANGGAELSVSDTSFGAEYNEALVHQLVTAYMAAGRAGTKRQKSRAEVRGGGRKPHAQKGTGSARAGSIRSPIWVGGGRAFAARPRSFEQKVNRKMYRAGLRSMLAQLVRTDRLVVTQQLAVAEPRTKLLVDELKKLSVQSALIVIEAQDDKLMLAARNLPHVEVITVADVNPLALASYDKVLMTVGAVKMIEERLQ